MTEVTVPKAVPLKGIPDVELVAVGAWNASTGPVVVTDDDLRAAVGALDCPGVHKPVLKLGHEEPDPDSRHMRWDGTPAVGWVSNIRLSPGAGKLLGDYTGMPAWLADVAPSAYPQRSVEIQRNFRCQIGHTHPFVITAVSLLGIYPPAVGVIRSLNDVQALYTLAAADGRPPAEVTRSIAVRLATPSPADTRRTLTEIERASRADFDRDRDEWEQSIADLLQAYGIVQRRQREQLTAQIAPLVDQGRYEELADLFVDARTAADTIYTEMYTAAQLAIASQVAEAAAQGVTGLTAVPDELFLRRVADGIASTMASSLAATAGRDAAQLAAPGASGVVVAGTVEEKLSDLSDRFLRDQFGGAIGAARMSGRYEVLEAAPTGEYYAAEVNDTSTCAKCKAIDGRRFDTLGDAMEAYGAGSYRDCLGGGRCRGRLVTVWAPRLSRVPIRVGDQLLFASIEMHLPGKHDQSSHGKGGKGKKQSSSDGDSGGGGDSAPANKAPAKSKDTSDGDTSDDGDGDTLTPLQEAGRAASLEAETAASVDQLVTVLQRHRKANPDVSAADLVAAADKALEAKYPQHPQLKGFYSKTISGRMAEVEGPPAKTAKPKPPPPPPKAKKAPAVSDGPPTLTAKQAQAMQDEMPPPWSGDERRGLRYYTGNSTVANGLLRRWLDPPGRTETERKKIDAAKRNIEFAVKAMRPAPQAVKVFRATNVEQFGIANVSDLDGLVGNELTDEGFMSTTTNKSFHLQGKVKMEIEIPEGAPMAFVKSVSKYPYEDEILLPPGTRYQVVSVERGKGRPKVRVRVIV